MNVPDRQQKRQAVRAQAIVEFAIVMPILMMVLLGVFEVGRLIFIYSAVTNASREAARFGSAIGYDDAGYHKYKDCAGIRNVAKHSAYFMNLTDSNIVIGYDHGPNTGPTYVQCDLTTSGEDPNVVVASGDRIIVTITGNYSPLTKLVPIGNRTVTSSSSRTILSYASVGSTTVSTAWPTVTPPAGTPGIPSPTNTPTITLTPTDTLTPTITPTPGPTNTPTNTPTATPTLAPNKTNTPTSAPTNTPTATNTPAPTSTSIPTNTPTNTPTRTPTSTPTNTPTSTPTPTTTPISCTPLTHGSISISGSTMSMFINNGTGFSLSVQSITVTWNNQGGVKLISASLGSTFWSDANGVNGPTYTITPTNLFIPTGSSTITFTFSKSFTGNGTERIVINLATNGCTSVDSSK